MHILRTTSTDTLPCISVVPAGFMCHYLSCEHPRQRWFHERKDFILHFFFRYQESSKGPQIRKRRKPLALLVMKAPHFPCHHRRLLPQAFNILLHFRGAWYCVGQESSCAASVRFDQVKGNHSEKDLSIYFGDPKNRPVGNKQKSRHSPRARLWIDGFLSMKSNPCNNTWQYCQKEDTTHQSCFQVFHTVAVKERC